LHSRTFVTSEAAILAPGLPDGTGAAWTPAVAKRRMAERLAYASVSFKSGIPFRFRLTLTGKKTSAREFVSYQQA
jgi:hypothetical protein